MSENTAPAARWIPLTPEGAAMTLRQALAITLLLVVTPSLPGQRPRRTPGRAADGMEPGTKRCAIKASSTGRSPPRGKCSNSTRRSAAGQPGEHPAHQFLGDLLEQPGQIRRRGSQYRRRARHAAVRRRAFPCHPFRPHAGAQPEKVAGLTAEQRQRLRQADRDLARADNLSAKKQHVEAIALGRKGLDAHRELLGETDVDTLNALTGFAQLHRQAGMPDAAVPLLKQEVELARKLLGAGHPSYFASVHNLGSLQRRRRDYAAAEPLLKEALEGVARVLGKTAPEYASCLQGLGVLYSEMRQLAKAAALLTSAAALARQAHGADSPPYLRALTNLAAVYEARGDAAKAIPPLAESIAGRKKLRGADQDRDLALLLNTGSLRPCRRLCPRGKRYKKPPRRQKSSKVRNKHSQHAEQLRHDVRDDGRRRAAPMLEKA